MARSAYTLVLGLIGAMLANGPALAQSTVCASLSSDLAALDRRAPAYDPYGDALVKQKAAIDRANADYQRQCGTGFFSRPSPACPALAERIQAMQGNLEKLERTAPKFAARNEDPQRRNLMAMLKQNHCGEPGSAIVTTYDRPTPGMLTVGPAPGSRRSDAAPLVPQSDFGHTFTLSGPNGPVLYREEPGGRVIALGPVSRFDPAQRRSPIFTNVPDDGDDPDRRATDPGGDAGQGDLSGTFRTLCVRTCDGYYFPISYSAGHSQFSTDADVCRARCPGTETRLYVVKTPGEDGEQSFAADSGEPYTKLPNALRYRREVVNACTCGRPDPALMPAAALPQEDRAIGGSTKVGDLRPELPVPDALPPRGEDPETLADIASDFVPHPIEPPSATAATSVGGDGLRGATVPKTIRVVGPKFYADR